MLDLVWSAGRKGPRLTVVQPLRGWGAWTRCIASLLLAICVVPAAGRDLGDVLDGVASYMGADLDAVASAMGTVSSADSFDFDGIAAAMGGGAPAAQLRAADTRRSEFDGVAEEMSIAGTLNYINNAFSFPSNSYLTTFGPGRTGQGHSAMLPAGAVLPITGVITSRFGFRPKYNRMHKGVDIALAVGDTVCAAMSGQVARVDSEPKGYGLFVVIKHDNGMETRYAHLSSALVWPGQTVAAGEPVALGGNTGNSTGPHLHFEIRVQGTAVDPTTMFDFTRPGGDYPAWDLRAGYGGLMASGATGYGTATPASTARGDKGTYVVRVGDTVQSVARAHGVSVLALCRLNMISTYEALEPGRMLRLR